MAQQRLAALAIPPSVDKRPTKGPSLDSTEATYLLHFLLNAEVERSPIALSYTDEDEVVISVDLDARTVLALKRLFAHYI